MYLTEIQLFLFHNVCISRPSSVFIRLAGISRECHREILSLNMIIPANSNFFILTGLVISYAFEHFTKKLLNGLG